MRRPRLLAILVLAATLLVPFLAPRAAGGAEAAAAFYTEGVARLGPDAAKALWQAADTARKRDLHEFAADTAELALEYDPDHKRARKHLGFQRKRGTWVLDPDEAEEVLRENEQPKRMSDEDFAAFQRTWREEDLREALRLTAGLFAELGDACAEKGFDVEARKAREEALRLDPDCAKARAGLGYERVGDAWMTSELRAARAAVPPPEIVDEECPLEEVLGADLTYVRSPHLRTESVFDAERTTKLVETLETAYAYHVADAGRDPGDNVFGRPIKACLVVDADHWSKWLKARVPERAAAFRDQFFYRTSVKLLLGVRENADAGHDPALQLEDNAVHAFTHLLNDRVWNLHGHPWLDEGLAYYYTLKVRGRTESWCVAADAEKQGGRFGSGIGEQVTQSDWRHDVKELVVAGDDMDLDVLVSRTLNELHLAETVKAWSFATWLMETDRERALAFLTKMRTSSAAEDTLEAHFDQSLEDIDAAWRDWVRRTH